MSQYNFGAMPPTSIEKWENPWHSPCTAFLPPTLESAWDMSKFLYAHSPAFAAGMQRVGSHFITTVSADESETGDRREKTAWCDWMMEELKINLACAAAVMDQSCFGNCFFRIAFPFDRWLIDTRDGRFDYHAIGKFREEDTTYHYNSLQYEVPDPRNPRKKVKFPFVDMKSTDRSRIKLVKLLPERCILQMSAMGGSKSVIYMFDPQMVADVKTGKALFQINDTPIEMLRAIKEDKYFKFDQGEIFHFMQPSPTGMSKNDWGIPPPIMHYRSLFKLAMYQKIDETVARDFMLPYRVMSPSDKIGDMASIADLGIWQSAVSDLIANRRMDPTSVHSFPFPIIMGQMSGDGKNLVPKDLIKYQTDSTLNDAGVPVELFQGSLQVQTIPATLRFFENSNLHFRVNINSFTKWVSVRVRNYLNMSPISVRMLQPSMADNLENKQILIQMAAGGEIPRSEPYRMLALGNPVDLARARDQEDADIQKNREEIRKQLEAEAMSNGSLQTTPEGGIQAAGGPVGGPPVGPQQIGGAGPTPENVPVTPTDIANQAQQIAEDLLEKGDPANTRRTLAALRAKNDGETMYAAVKQKMDAARNQAESAGRQQVGARIQDQKAQARAGAPPAPPQ